MLPLLTATLDLGHVGEKMGVAKRGLFLILASQLNDALM